MAPGSRIPAAAAETKGFVVSWFHIAEYADPQGRDCPHGVNDGPEIYYRRELKQSGLPQAQMTPAADPNPEVMPLEIAMHWQLKVTCVLTSPAAMVLRNTYRLVRIELVFSLEPTTVPLATPLDVTLAMAPELMVSPMATPPRAGSPARGPRRSPTGRRDPRGARSPAPTGRSPRRRA